MSSSLLRWSVEAHARLWRQYLHSRSSFAVAQVVSSSPTVVDALEMVLGMPTCVSRPSFSGRATVGPARGILPALPATSNPDEEPVAGKVVERTRAAAQSAFARSPALTRARASRRAEPVRVRGGGGGQGGHGCARPPRDGTAPDASNAATGRCSQGGNLCCAASCALPLPRRPARAPQVAALWRARHVLHGRHPPGNRRGAACPPRRHLLAGRWCDTFGRGGGGGDSQGGRHLRPPPSPRQLCKPLPRSRHPFPHDVRRVHGARRLYTQSGCAPARRGATHHGLPPLLSPHAQPLIHFSLAAKAVEKVLRVLAEDTEEACRAYVARTSGVLLGLIAHRLLSLTPADTQAMHQHLCGQILGSVRRRSAAAASSLLRTGPSSLPHSRRRQVEWLLSASGGGSEAAVHGAAAFVAALSLHVSIALLHSSSLPRRVVRCLRRGCDTGPGPHTACPPPVCRRRASTW